jgi:hypothetical protein
LSGFLDLPRSAVDVLLQLLDKRKQLADSACWRRTASARRASVTSSWPI